MAAIQSLAAANDAANAFQVLELRPDTDSDEPSKFIAGDSRRCSVVRSIGTHNIRVSYVLLVSSEFNR